MQSKREIFFKACKKKKKKSSLAEGKYKLIFSFLFNVAVFTFIFQCSVCGNP